MDINNQFYLRTSKRVNKQIIWILKCEYRLAWDAYEITREYVRKTLDLSFKYKGPILYQNQIMVLNEIMQGYVLNEKEFT